MDKSTDWQSLVNVPIEIKSMPDSAMGSSVWSLMPPEASSFGAVPDSVFIELYRFA